MGVKRLLLKWHPEASNDLTAITRYCYHLFGRTVSRQVRNKIFQSVEVLRGNPFLGHIEPLLSGCTALEYRTLLVNRRTKVIYTVHADYVYIHLLWDVRQDDKQMVETTVRRYPFPNSEQYMLNEPQPQPYGKQRVNE